MQWSTKTLTNKTDQRVSVSLIQSFVDPGGKSVSEVTIGENAQQDVWSFLFLGDLFHSNKYDFSQIIKLVCLSFSLNLYFSFTLVGIKTATTAWRSTSRIKFESFL